jgi:hypothetical protein
MFHLLEAGKVVAPLYDPAQYPGVTNNHVWNILHILIFFGTWNFIL